MSLPFSILSGFLGSGKTTLLRHLLGQSGQERIAVVVNEYASLPIDHLLLAEAPGEVLVTPGGCLCCAPAGELASCIARLLEQVDEGRIAPLDRLLIETSGLADPAAVLASVIQHPALGGRLRFDGFLITVDMLNGLRQLAEFPESAAQIAVADRLLLTKPDLVDSLQQAEYRERLSTLAPSARQLIVSHGSVEAEALFGAGLYEPNRGFRLKAWLQGENRSLQGVNHRHSSGIAVFVLRLPRTTLWAQLQPWLHNLTQWQGERILRIKGVLHLADVDTPLAVHAVHHMLYPPVELPELDLPEAGLVFIVRELELNDLILSAAQCGIELKPE